MHLTARQGLGQGGAAGFAGFGGGQAGAPRETKLDITPADFGVFEQRLAAIQTAFGAEDFEHLRALATPEMASFFAEDLAANAKKGLVNKVSDVTFLQGDLAEAWREPQSEYATVAMRFSLIDTMADRVSGKLVSGDPAVPQQVTEVWTFARRAGRRPKRLEAIGDPASLSWDLSPSCTGLIRASSHGSCRLDGRIKSGHDGGGRRITLSEIRY